MGVLRDVLEYKARQEAQEAQTANAIPQAVAAFIQGRQQQQQNMIDMLKIDATLAASGLRRTPSGFTRDESLSSPGEQFLTAGKYADALNNLREAGLVNGGTAQVGGAPSLLAPTGQLNVPSSQPAQATATQPAQEGDMFSTGGTANVAGVLTSQNVKSESGMRRELGIKKEEAKQAVLGKEEATREFGAMKEATGSMRFVNQFERSFDEIQSKIPGFGETGVVGKAKRIGAKVLESADMLPETKTLTIRLKPIANQMARDVEGGRVTDQDRKIYADSLANTLNAPSETNSRLVSEQLIGFADKGADISKNVTALAESKNKVLNQIYSQVIEQYPEFRVVTVKNESGEKRRVTLMEARRLRGEK
jgi:hypothetical protein